VPYYTMYNMYIIHAHVKICKATDTEESHMSERNHVPWTLIFSLGLVLKVRVWKTKVR